MNLSLATSPNPNYNAAGAATTPRPLPAGTSASQAAYRPWANFLDQTNTANSWQDNQNPWAELVLAFEWGGMGSRPNAKVSDQISSRHGGIIISAYCDGHVTQLNEQLDINVFRQIMCPSDTQTVATLTTMGLTEVPTTLFDEANLP
jgi:hypothetical protein